jgi:iron(II)-dependent oxidoreductase
MQDVNMNMLHSVILIVAIGSAQPQPTSRSADHAGVSHELIALANQLNPTLDSSAKIHIREYKTNTEVRHTEYLAWFRGHHALLLQTLSPQLYVGRKILITRNDLFVSLPEARKPLRLPFQQRIVSDISYADMAWIKLSEDYRQTGVTIGNDKTFTLLAKTNAPVFQRIELHVDKTTDKPIEAVFIGPGNIQRNCHYLQFRNVLGSSRPVVLQFEDPTRSGWRAELTFVDWRLANPPDRLFSPAALNKFRLADQTQSTSGFNRDVATAETISGSPMVLVPAGTLMMGSDSGFPEEKPRHPVKVNAVLMDRCEVSVGDYESFVTKKHISSLLPSPIVESAAPRDYLSNPKYRSYPVVNVSWYSAAEYCQWHGKRLPSETEWEWAARGPADRLYPWGNSWNDSALVPPVSSDNVHFTSACASRPNGVSQFGVYDLAGNVSEWVADWYEPYPNSDAEDPSFGTSFKVVRGGSWLSRPSALTALARDFGDPARGYESVGFRCAKDE